MLRTALVRGTTGTSSCIWGQVVVLLLLASLQPGSSFLAPTTPIARSRAFVIWKTYAAGTSNVEPEVPTQGQAPSGKEPAGVVVAEEADDGMPKSPAGLTLEGVYKKLKLETQGLDEGIVGLESKDTDYGVRAFQV